MHAIKYISGLLFVCLTTVHVNAQKPAYVRFDVSPVTIAQNAQATETMFVPEGFRLVRFNLDISSLIDSPTGSKPHEFQYQLRCGNKDSRVVDYSPRTQLSDETNGGVQIEEIDERTKSFGLNVNGSYHGIVRADGGGDMGHKQTEKRKFEQVVSREIVYASGTLQRGQGVYFKIRLTPQHVLDGQKRFSVTLQVPNAWRGELIDLRLSAMESIRPFPVWERESRVTSFARYKVAVVDKSEKVAQRWAREMGSAEQELRSIAAIYAERIRERSAPTIFHHVAIAFDMIEPKISDDWLHRALYDQIDPYFDKQIRHLPVDVKVAILDYLETKSKFVAYINTRSQSQEAHSDLAVN